MNSYNHWIRAPRRGAVYSIAALLGPLVTAGVTRAQVLVEPAFLVRVVEAPVPDLPAAEAPELEPVVGLATLVVALRMAVADGRVEFSAAERAGLENWLRPLTEGIVLSRRKAASRAEKFSRCSPLRRRRRW